MTIELKGTIVAIMTEKQVTDNFSKQEFVIRIDEETDYPNEILVQATNTKIGLLKGVAINNKVLIKCNLGGKKTKDGKWFNQLSVWAIENKTNQ
jgi:hypothetical protein